MKIECHKLYYIQLFDNDDNNKLRATREYAFVEVELYLIIEYCVEKERLS